MSDLKADAQLKLNYEFKKKPVPTMKKKVG